MTGVVAVLLLAGCAGETGRVHAEAAPVDTDRLVGVEWRLTKVVEPSGAWSPEPDADVRLRFDGAGGWSGEPCNHLSGTVTIDPDVVVFVGVAGTDMACHGQRAALEKAYQTVVSGEVRWRVEDGELRLDKPGGQGLRFRASELIYPAAGIVPLLEGRRGTAEYRFGRQDCAPEICLRWEQRDGPGRPWGTEWRAFSRPSAGQMVNSVGKALFLGGVVPPGTARVVYQPPAGGPAVELELFDVPEVSMGRVFGGFVEAPTAGASWIARDADGRDLLRRDDLPAPPLPWS